MQLQSTSSNVYISHFPYSEYSKVNSVNHSLALHQIPNKVEKSGISQQVFLQIPIPIRNRRIVCYDK